MVYFETTDISIVSLFSGKRFDPTGMSHWGYTNFKTTKDGRTGALIDATAASEVYAKMLVAETLGALAFHE